jgi:serine/threonine-protein kinase
MGTVHLGRLSGLEGFDRVVAIKRAHPEVARDRDLAAMFLDEARVAARIRHPNVAAALDLVDADGELWLVLEYVHGAALTTLLRSSSRGRGVPVAVASAIGAGMLQGLHAAHETKDASGEPLCIVHRDVSPQNVIVGCDGVARIIDFGVAKAAGQQHHTTVGQIKGKLAYLAPERLHGIEPDRRIDVFAAAVVLWEMLTGLKLFDGTNEAEVLAQTLHPVIPSPREVNPEVPEALAAVVLRGLDPDPSLRFQTALQMVQALERETVLSSPNEVGQWVAETARETLAERTQLLARIETTSAGPSRDADPSSNKRLRDRLAAVVEPVHREAQATVIVSLSPRPKSYLKNRPAIWRVAMAATLLTIGGLLAFASPPNKGPVAAPLTAVTGALPTQAQGAAAAIEPVLPTLATSSSVPLAVSASGGTAPPRPATSARGGAPNPRPAAPTQRASPPKVTPPSAWSRSINLADGF